MSDALMFSEGEVRRVVRLLADALTPNDGRAAKCRRLMTGLCDLVGADAWFWFRTRMEAGVTAPVNLDFLYDGVDERQVAMLAERALEVEGEPPEHPPLKALVAEGKHFSRSRPQLVPDTVWRLGPTAAFVERFGLDAWVYSVVPVADDDRGRVISVVLVLRKVGRADFDERETRLIHIITGECGPLHAEGICEERIDDLVRLTPRLRTVLALLVDGLSAKEIAHQLSLSPHTVNDYVKQVYRHFGVGSRAELLRQFMTGEIGSET